MTDLNSSIPTTPGPKKSTPVGMIITSIVLGVALIFLIYMYFDKKNKMIEMETALTQEKDSLANELRHMVVAFDTLKTNNDTLKAGMEKQKNKIVQILSINASNVRLIKSYKNEITTMREIMKSYIVQIDSLNTRNKLLTSENSEIKEQITQVRNTNTELSKAKEELSTKVEVASVIQAKNIAAVSLNKKRKETTRINNLDKLRICFTLRENPLAKPGQKDVYMRVIRPDSFRILKCVFLWIIKVILLLVTTVLNFILIIILSVEQTLCFPKNNYSSAGIINSDIILSDINFPWFVRTRDFFSCFIRP